MTTTNTSRVSDSDLSHWGAHDALTVLEGTERALALVAKMGDFASAHQHAEQKCSEGFARGPHTNGFHQWRGVVRAFRKVAAGA